MGVSGWSVGGERGSGSGRCRELCGKVSNRKTNTNSVREFKFTLSSSAAGIQGAAAVAAVAGPGAQLGVGRPRNSSPPPNRLSPVHLGPRRDPARYGPAPTLPGLGLVPSPVHLPLPLLPGLGSAHGADLLPRRLDRLAVAGDLAGRAAVAGSEGEELGHAEGLAVSAPCEGLNAHSWFGGLVCG